MDNVHTLAIITAVSLVTIVLRFLPFWVFGNGRQTPRYIVYLGQVLPYAMIGMLVVYCLKEVSFASAAQFVPTMLSVLVVALTYLWKKNVLVSIGCGTLCNMLLVQLVF